MQFPYSKLIFLSLGFSGGWLLAQFCQPKDPASAVTATAPHPEAKASSTPASKPVKNDPVDQPPDAAKTREPAPGKWSGKSPGEIADELAKIADRRLQSTAINAAVSELAREDPLGALRLAELLPRRSQRENAMEQVMREWMRKDAAAATEYLIALEDSPHRDTLLSASAQALSDKDLRASIQLASHIGTKSAQDSAFMSIGVQWGSKEPEAAAAWCLASDSNYQREHTLMHLISHWGRRDPVAMKAWALANLNGTQGEAIAQRAMDTLGSEDFQEVQSFYAALSPELQKKTSVRYAQSWAIENPEQAVRWAASLPDVQTRSEALSSVVSAWTNEDPNAASAWLNTLPRDDNRDRLVTNFVHAAQRDDPEGAMLWARSVSNEGNRSSLILSVARNWMQNDPVAAKPWIQTSPDLTAEQRENLLKMRN